MFPLVTIAIPTYNRADCYLKQAIQSALHQTYPNIEIIVSDNCSTDNTESIVKDFKDSRIRYFRQERNIGANNNFNFCLQQAKGDYFSFLHDDDLIDPDFIEICLKAVNHKTEFGIIRTGTRVIDSKGRVLSETLNRVGGLSTEEFILGWFAGKTIVYLCSTLFNTARLREIGGFKSKHHLYQDVMAELRLASKFGRADVEDVKASTRIHDDKMAFAAKVGQWCEDALILVDLMCEIALKDKDKIRREGMKNFSKASYGNARRVKSPMQRWIAYFTVFRKFHYCHFPPKDHISPPIYLLFYGTPIYDGLRFIKRKFTLWQKVL